MEQEQPQAQPLEIPTQYAASWNRLLHRLPPKLRTRVQVQESVLTFLKLGGERLARQAIDVARTSLAIEESEQRKRQKEAAMQRALERMAAEARQAEQDALDRQEEEGDDLDAGDEEKEPI